MAVPYAESEGTHRIRFISNKETMVKEKNQRVEQHQATIAIKAWSMNEYYRQQFQVGRKFAHWRKS